MNIRLPRGMRLLELDSTASTNTVAAGCARAGEAEGLVVMAETQTAGRGRRGRAFFSPGGTGLYMSILLRPKLPPERAVLLTAAAAVAVCRALEGLGEAPSIKWVNDVYLRGKKVCGILTESAVSAGGAALDYAVVGIGLNISEPRGGFPAELGGIAGGVSVAPSEGLRERLAEAILGHFALFSADPGSCVSAYAERVTPRGTRIDVISAAGTRSAVVLGTDEKCRLLVRYDGGGEEALSSGEISIKTRLT